MFTFPRLKEATMVSSYADLIDEKKVSCLIYAEKLRRIYIDRLIAF